MEKKKVHFRVIRFMSEAGHKLRMKPVSLATAAMVYHKIVDTDSTWKSFDPYLIATTSIYLASKIEEDHAKIRDVVNVCYRCMHPDLPPLDMGTTYNALKDSVAHCELFLLRMLKFHVTFEHPHKYLLYFLDSLEKWLAPDKQSTKDIVAMTAWGLLTDSYHGNMCLRYTAKDIAVATLYLALQCYGVEVPCNKESELPWYEAFVEGIKIQTIRKIIGELIDLYDLETLAIPGKTAPDGINTSRQEAL